MDPRPVVLVTGAARRLGRAIALDLAAHGFDVAIHHRQGAADLTQTLAEARQHGARAQAFCADLGDEAQTRALLPQVAAQFGAVAAVVNNASTFEFDDATSFTYAALERQMRINAAAAVVLAQALHHQVREHQGRGCVVNVLDQKLWNPNPDHLSYTMSKAALECANTALAMALAPHVRVCAVAPGLTLPSGPMDEAEFARAHRMTPLGRASDAGDIARTVRFLLESPAITGTTVLVDGGQHLSAQPRDVLFLARQAGASA